MYAPVQQQSIYIAAAGRQARAKMARKRKGAKQEEDQRGVVAQQPVTLEPPVRPGGSSTNKVKMPTVYNNSDVEAVMSRVVRQRKALAAQV